MRTSWNIAVQAGALGLAVLLRLVAPGWLLIVLVVSVVGLLLPAAPLITAVLTRRRGRLGWAVQSPFLALAALMVIAAGWTADFDDQRDYVPAVELFGPGADLGLGRGELARIGEFAVLGYLGCLVWLLLALMATTRVRTIPMTG